MLNVVALMGRLVRDPELKTTQSGNSVCTFSIACDRSYTAKDEERKADFFTITAWRQTAEFICKYFQKGSLIAIEGILQTRQYQDKNGNNRTATEVLASRVSFAGSKASGSPSAQSSEQQTNYDAQNANASQNAPQAASGSDDFSVIDDGDDLPF
nr:MAG TPA: Single strand binding protein [Caudoviricetes sp.]DAT71252.1 MAG TPA: Single strand binding protein [Caudoviricetes sp.]